MAARSPNSDRWEAASQSEAPPTDPDGSAVPRLSSLHLTTFDSALLVGSVQDSLYDPEPAMAARSPPPSLTNRASGLPWVEKSFSPIPSAASSRPPSVGSLAAALQQSPWPHPSPDVGGSAHSSIGRRSMQESFAGSSGYSVHPSFMPLNDTQHLLPSHMASTPGIHRPPTGHFSARDSIPDSFAESDGALPPTPIRPPGNQSRPDVSGLSFNGEAGALAEEALARPVSSGSGNKLFNPASRRSGTFLRDRLSNLIRKTSSGRSDSPQSPTESENAFSSSRVGRKQRLGKHSAPTTPLLTEAVVHISPRTSWDGAHDIISASSVSSAGRSLGVDPVQRSPAELVADFRQMQEDLRNAIRSKQLMEQSVRAFNLDLTNARAAQRGAEERAETLAGQLTLARESHEELRKQLTTVRGELLQCQKQSQGLRKERRDYADRLALAENETARLTEELAKVAEPTSSVADDIARRDATIHEQAADLATRTAELKGLRADHATLTDTMHDLMDQLSELRIDGKDNSPPNETRRDGASATLRADTDTSRLREEYDNLIETLKNDQQTLRETLTDLMDQLGAKKEELAGQVTERTAEAKVRSGLEDRVRILEAEIVTLEQRTAATNAWQTQFHAAEKEAVQLAARLREAETAEEIRAARLIQLEQANQTLQSQLELLRTQPPPPPTTRAEDPDNEADDTLRLNALQSDYEDLLRDFDRQEQVIAKLRTDLSNQVTAQKANKERLTSLEGEVEKAQAAEEKLLSQNVKLESDCDELRADLAKSERAREAVEIRVADLEMAAIEAEAGRLEAEIQRDSLMDSVAAQQQSAMGTPQPKGSDQAAASPAVDAVFAGPTDPLPPAVSGTTTPGRQVSTNPARTAQASELVKLRAQLLNFQTRRTKLEAQIDTHTRTVAEHELSLEVSGTRLETLRAEQRILALRLRDLLLENHAIQYEIDYQQNRKDNRADQLQASFLGASSEPDVLAPQRARSTDAIPRTMVPGLEVGIQVELPVVSPEPALANPPVQPGSPILDQPLETQRSSAAEDSQLSNGHLDRALSSVFSLADQVMDERASLSDRVHELDQERALLAQQLASREEELRRLRKDSAHLRDQLSHLRAASDGATVQTADHATALADRDAQLRRARGEIDDLRQRLDTKTTALEAAEKRHHDHLAACSDRMNQLVADHADATRRADELQVQLWELERRPPARVPGVTRGTATSPTPSVDEAERPDSLFSAGSSPLPAAPHASVPDLPAPVDLTELRTLRATVDRLTTEASDRQRELARVNDELHAERRLAATRAGDATFRATLDGDHRDREARRHQQETADLRRIVDEQRAEIAQLQLQFDTEVRRQRHKHSEGDTERGVPQERVDTLLATLRQRDDLVTDLRRQVREASDRAAAASRGEPTQCGPTVSELEAEVRRLDRQLTGERREGQDRLREAAEQADRHEQEEATRRTELTALSREVEELRDQLQVQEDTVTHLRQQMVEVEADRDRLALRPDESRLRTPRAASPSVPGAFPHASSVSGSEAYLMHTPSRPSSVAPVDHSGASRYYSAQPPERTVHLTASSLSLLPPSPAGPYDRRSTDVASLIGGSGRQLSAFARTTEPRVGSRRQSISSMHSQRTGQDSRYGFSTFAMQTYNSQLDGSGFTSHPALSPTVTARQAREVGRHRRTPSSSNQLPPPLPSSAVAGPDVANLIAQLQLKEFDLQKTQLLHQEQGRQLHRAQSRVDYLESLLADNERTVEQLQADLGVRLTTIQDLQSRLDESSRAAFHDSVSSTPHHHHRPPRDSLISEGRVDEMVALNAATLAQVEQLCRRLQSDRSLRTTSPALSAATGTTAQDVGLNDEPGQGRTRARSLTVSAANLKALADALHRGAHSEVLRELGAYVRDMARTLESCHTLLHCLDRRCQDDDQGRRTFNRGEQDDGAYTSPTFTSVPDLLQNLRSFGRRIAAYNEFVQLFAGLEASLASSASTAGDNTDAAWQQVDHAVRDLANLHLPDPTLVRALPGGPLTPAVATRHLCGSLALIRDALPDLGQTHSTMDSLRTTLNRTQLECDRLRNRNRQLAADIGDRAAPTNGIDHPASPALATSHRASRHLENDLATYQARVAQLESELERYTREVAEQRDVVQQWSERCLAAEAESRAEQRRTQTLREDLDTANDAHQRAHAQLLTTRRDLETANRTIDDLRREAQRTLAEHADLAQQLTRVGAQEEQLRRLQKAHAELENELAAAQRRTNQPDDEEEGRIKSLERELAGVREELAVSKVLSNPKADYSGFDRILKFEKDKHAAELRRLKHRHHEDLANERYRANRRAEEQQQLLAYRDALLMREHAFRADLGYQKQYLMMLIGGWDQVKSATIVLIHKMGLSTEFPTRPRKPSVLKFHKVVLSLIFIQRMRICARRHHKILAMRPPTYRSQVDGRTLDVVGRAGAAGSPRLLNTKY
ncbi:hypothetical protein IWQ60_003340 [Tieghemiomyces parasiticus]|uniref:Pericentrin/AKAP-450 centrosomal targeting domain-containing protein n=1 Tax=Tieghemiomyces parasiticus TaxID=78921 RepID=A0A9W8AD27_9FUNG|nr:hypothetical protein IWQ60_003340 [Tieghemiomyces parasiticus]